MLSPERLASALDKRGFSQRHFAALVGVREATVSGWVHGKPAGRDSVLLAASVLGVSVDWLLGLSDDAAPLTAAPAQPDTRSGGSTMDSDKSERDRLLDMLQDALRIADKQADANKAQAVANERTAAAAERAAAAAERLAAQLSPLRSEPPQGVREKEQTGGPA